MTSRRRDRIMKYYRKPADADDGAPSSDPTTGDGNA
jgi:hypothetical protein